MMDQNFKKLQELIKDDDQIVTISSFACEANISIAESKETFDKYVELSQEIIKTYILNGKKKSENHISVALVKEDNLKEQKELYQDGFYQTIFSIQKAKNVDFNVIALADSVDSMVEKHFISGSTIGTNCFKRTLRKKVLPTLPPATVKGKSTIFSKQNSAVKSGSVKIDSNDDGFNENNKNKGHTQNNIASLFNNAQSKKPDQKDIQKPEKNKKTNGGLSNFFTKQPSKGLENKEVKAEKSQKAIKSSSKDTEILKDFQIKEDAPSKKITQKEQEQTKTNHGNNHKQNDLFDSDTDDEILKDLEIKEEKPSEKKQEKAKAKAKGTSSQKKKRGVNDVGNNKSVKKRKRIIVDDESDSDDIFGSDKSDSEGLIEKSDEELEPVKAEKKPLPPKNKRRKAVDKTYEDEDGYIVTKTEYVYETPSEDENEPENKIPKIEEKPKVKIEKKGSSNSENDISPKKGTKSKKGTNKKAPSGNQPTLMNFFKKK